MAKKSKYDLIDEEIQNYQIMNNTSYVPKEELFLIFQSYLDIPTGNELKTRYISTKVSAYLGRKKNFDGTRKFISTGTGGFTYIETENDVENLDGALEQLNKRSAGLDKSIEKVKTRKIFLETQVSFDEVAASKEG